MKQNLALTAWGHRLWNLPSPILKITTLWNMSKRVIFFAVTEWRLNAWNTQICSSHTKGGSQNRGWEGFPSVPYDPWAYTQGTFFLPPKGEHTQGVHWPTRANTTLLNPALLQLDTFSVFITISDFQSTHSSHLHASKTKSSYEHIFMAVMF